MDNKFHYKSALADGSTMYVAAHELNNEVCVTFPPGYFNENPPSELEIDLAVGIKSRQQKEEFNWRISINRKNHEGTGDKPSFEVYNVYPPLYFQMWGLEFTDNSNWSWPWALKVVGGSIGVTHAQMVDLMAQFAKLVRPKDA